MPLKIQKIVQNSLAEKTKLKPGYSLISINDHPINDYLDLQFYSADENLQIKYKNESGLLKTIKIIQNWEKPLGIEPEEMICRTCINNCIFCFVDQMHPKTRKTLHIKDDDFRFSFTFGNYITLTNLTKKDYDKIIEQRLSPLYISVHTTDPILHKKMLRYQIEFDLNEKLRFLSEYKIFFHTQIVVVPGWNDNEILQKTLFELSNPELNVLSIGIVPVGLTKFRKDLTSLKSVDKKKAKELLAISEKFDHAFCSDEIYLLAEEKIPETDFYEDFPQLENGIGMVSLFSENWTAQKRDFVNFVNKLKANLVFVTAELMADFMHNFCKKLDQEVFPNVRASVVKNLYLGRKVTVSGLLTAQDIFEQIELGQDEVIVLSGNMFNNEKKTLDNKSIEQMQTVYKRILIIDEEFADWKLYHKKNRTV